MAATAAFPPIGAHEKAMQLYGYRRFASTPGFVDHTPRDTIRNPEIKDFTDFAIRRINIPRHLDLTLPAATRACYWSEDERKPNKAHFTASTHSRSAPTSPVEERKTFLQPRVPQYETNSTTADVAHFLRETAPVRKADAEEGKLHRETSVRKKKNLVKKTARRVLEAGNRQLPEQCQLPQWQRAPSPERPPIVERRAKSGKRYYQIVPGTFDLTDGDQSQPERGTARTDWAPQHQTIHHAIRARNTPSRREGRVGTSDDETTDAYATFSEGEGPWFSQSHYEPGTALGDPDHAQYTRERQISGDSGMVMARKSSVATVDSRIADSELTDNERYRPAPNALSSMSNAATPRKSTSRSNYKHTSRTSFGSGYTQVLVEGGRPISQALPHHSARRTSGQSPDRFQATLKAFPPTPSNVPTRDSSIKTYAPTQEVKSVASALQARADRARARKLRDLQQVRKPSVGGSEGSVHASDARISSEAVSGVTEPTYEQNKAQRKQKSKTSSPTSVETCPHGFNVCPHDCKHGHYEPYHSEEIAYRASLPLPPPPAQQREYFNHPALRTPDWSSSPSMPAPLRASMRPTHSANRSRANSSTTPAPPPASSSSDERDLQIQLLQSQIDELRQRDLRMNAALALLTSAGAGGQFGGLGMNMNFANLFSPASSTTDHANAQAVSAAAAAGAAAGVAAAQAQQAMQAHHAQQQQQQQFQNTPLPTRNDSTNSKTSTSSEKRASGESGADVISFTSVEDGGGVGGGVYGGEDAQQQKMSPAQGFPQGSNVLEMYMMTRKCSLTPPIEE